MPTAKRASEVIAGDWLIIPGLTGKPVLVEHVDRGTSQVDGVQYVILTVWPNLTKEDPTPGMLTIQVEPDRPIAIHYWDEDAPMS